MLLQFKQWLEDYTVFGGLEPPIEQPVDPEPSKGQTDAFPRFCMKGSKELPVTASNRKNNVKKMKKK